jgi:hypothetical protein
MTEEKQKSVWWFVINQARTARLLLNAGELQELLGDFGKAETLTPLLDPTFWVQHADGIEDRGRLLRATAAYVREIEAIAAEEERRKKGLANATGNDAN